MMTYNVEMCGFIKHYNPTYVDYFLHDYCLVVIFALPKTIDCCFL